MECAADPLSTLVNTDVVAIELLDELDELLDVCGTGAVVFFVLTTMPHRGAPFAYRPMATRLGVDCGVAGVRAVGDVILVDCLEGPWSTGTAGDLGGWTGNESASCTSES